MGEPDATDLKAKLAAATEIVVPSTSLVEVFIVLSHRTGANPTALIDHFLVETGTSVVAFGQIHAETAGDAFLRFGKGRHAAALNYGDCMAYAVAKVAGLPLLYVGGDFAKTDIEPA